jgi:uncharacterized membrane-anchored protein
MKFLTTFFLLFCCVALFAKDGDKPKKNLSAEEKAFVKFMDSVESSLQYKNGVIQTLNGVASLNVPSSFKFLGAEQSNYIIEKVWGNPPQKDVLGILFPKDGSPFNDTYAFIVSYDESGYVKDKDADGINYDKMMTEMQKDEITYNVERKKQGYGSIHLKGWASKPFYDKEKKVLHWAKDLTFEDNTEHTLNYDVRVLGRKGVLSLNAVAPLDQLALVKQNIDSVLNIATFNSGYTYNEYNSKTDKVAAYTVGGLIAGKVLAKVGLWAVLGKFFIAAWKFILIGIIAAWGFIKKFFTRKKVEEHDFQQYSSGSNPEENVTNVEEVLNETKIEEDPTIDNYTTSTETNTSKEESTNNKV